MYCNIVLNILLLHACELEAFQFHLLPAPTNIQNQVKGILTPGRTTALILLMVVYQSVFSALMYAQTGPPYDRPSPRRFLYFVCSFSAPSFICFFIVLVSTILLVIRLKQNLEWRNEAAKQSQRGSKELRVARSVIAVCTIFTICFVPNVSTKFEYADPYLGNLTRIVFVFTALFQVVNSAVNIFVYYSMSTKYREVFIDLFCKKRT